MKLKSSILNGIMSSLTFDDFLLEINYLKQLKNFKNLYFNKIYKWNLLQIMNFLEAKYSQID